MSRKQPKYLDAGDLSENERIRMIGRAAMVGNVVCFIVEDDGVKADRYVEKLKRRYPKVIVLDRLPGPIEGMTTVKVGLPHTEN